MSTLSQIAQAEAALRLTEKLKAWTRANEQLPPPQTPVIYLTDFYQSAGYVEGNGQWYFATGKAEGYPAHWWQEI